MSTEPKQEEQKQVVQSDADLLQKIAMLEARLDVREKQLKQAIDIANRANDEMKATESKERQKLIDSIQQDSKFDKDELANKSLNELNTIRITLDRSIEKTFASVAQEIDENRRRKQPLLTAGTWDNTTKTWTGGL